MLLLPEVIPNAYTPPPRRLLGPGPSDISTRVLQALAKPTIGYLDPSFVGMMEELKTLLRYSFQTKDTITANNHFITMIDHIDKAHLHACRTRP